VGWNLLQTQHGALEAAEVPGRQRRARAIVAAAEWFGERALGDRGGPTGEGHSEGFMHVGTQGPWWADIAVQQVKSSSTILHSCGAIRTLPARAWSPVGGTAGRWLTSWARGDDDV
jgi:hypothetical protein